MLLLSLCTAALLQMGCTVDMSWVKGHITKMIEQQWPDAEIAAVECPEKVKKKKGDSFKCTVKLKDGGSIPFTVKQTDNDGSINVEAEKEIVVKTELADMITKAAKDKATGKADCGKGIFAIDKITPIECELPGVGTVLVTVEESGKVNWKPKDEADKDEKGKKK